MKVFMNDPKTSWTAARGGDAELQKFYESAFRGDVRQQKFFECLLT